MRHLQPRPFKPTLDIKPLVRLTAIQDTLVTTHSLRHAIQRLNNTQPQFLALLVLRHGDVLDVAHQTHVVDELALDDDGAGADDGGGLVADHQDVVRVVAGGDEVVAGVEFGEGGFAYGGEDTEGWEEACGLFVRMGFASMREGEAYRRSSRSGEAAGLNIPLGAGRRLLRRSGTERRAVGRSQRLWPLLGCRSLSASPRQLQALRWL
jgi:hypothetical protein